MKSKSNVLKDWKEIELREVVNEFVGGGTPVTSNETYWNGEIAWMTSAHMTHRFINEGQKYITTKGLKESATHLIPKNNLLVATRVGVGKVAINKIDIAISQDLTGLIVSKDIADNEYLYWFLLKNLSKIKSLAQGSTIKGILKEDLARLRVLLPEISEQRAIAHVLSTIDSQIEIVERERQATERLRSGIMSKLLGGKWPVVKFETICDKIRSGGTPLTSMKEYYKGEVPFVKIEDITNAGKYLESTQIKISSEGLEKSTAWLVPENSILLAIYGSLGEITINKIEVATNQAILGIILDKERADTEFVYYFFKNVKLRKYAKQSTQANLTAEIIRNLEISLPPLAEQKKIAEVLRTIDYKLDLETQRKDKLEKIKRGLMDELLTGKKRVNVDKILGVEK